jgi:hypothetical protein
LDGELVTQIFNLPYRRLAVGSASDRPTIGGLQIRDTTQRSKAATKDYEFAAQD